MTITEKRRIIENKLVGAENLYRIFNHTYFFLCGCATMGLFPLSETSSKRIVYLIVVCLVLALISRSLAKLFKSTRDQAQKQYTEHLELEKWSFNNN